MSITIYAIQCTECNDIIYSRTRHDFHWCSCNNCAIDGGFDYQKVCFKNDPPQPIEIVVEATKKELYDDWNKKIDKFGLIKNHGK